MDTPLLIEAPPPVAPDQTGPDVLVCSIVNRIFSGLSWLNCAVLILVMILAGTFGGQEQLRSDVATVRDSALKGGHA